jgi:hypothetical protein
MTMLPKRNMRHGTHLGICVLDSKQEIMIEVRVNKVSMGNPRRTHAVDAANKTLESVALEGAHCSLKWNVAALYQISQQLQND